MEILVQAIVLLLYMFSCDLIAFKNFGVQLIGGTVENPGTMCPQPIIIIIIHSIYILAVIVNLGNNWNVSEKLFH